MRTKNIIIKYVIYSLAPTRVFDIIFTFLVLLIKSKTLKEMKTVFIAAIFV